MNKEIKDLEVAVTKIGELHSFKSSDVISSYSNELIYVNGELVKGSTISINKPITSIEVYVKEKFPSFVEKFSEELPDIMLDEYYKKESILRKKMDNSLEDEFEYKKFYRDYKVIHQERLIKKQDVKFKVIEANDPKLPFVTMGRHNGEPVTDVTASFNIQGFLINYIHNYMKNKGYANESDKMSFKSGKGTYKIYHYNTGMVNLYIEGKQIFDVNHRNYTDSLENVKAKYESMEIWIKEKLDAYFENLREGINQNDINAMMNSIKSYASKLDVKVKSMDDYRLMMSKINSYIK